MSSATLQPGALEDIRRRNVVLAGPACVAGALVLPGCSSGTGQGSYQAAATRTWHVEPIAKLAHADLLHELVRCAALAPSSHNTQCWKFALHERAITILPDLARRCVAVDPDDHHLFVSLGCATENLAQAALAHGLHAEARFDADRNAIHVALEPTAAQVSPLFGAIATRQCTRGLYDGQPLHNDELGLLQRAGTSSRVRMLLLTARPAMEQVLAHVVQGNSAQMSDPAFMRELKAWIRFSSADAVRTADGLFSVCSGNPDVPGWLGNLAFRWAFTADSENDNHARHIRSSAGIAVFIGQMAGKADWVDVGRCYQRFALQATALGIRNAFLNQPVEVPALRPQFAAALGVAGERPDLVVRFGRGPAMPRSLRRPVQAVLA